MPENRVRRLWNRPPFRFAVGALLIVMTIGCVVGTLRLEFNDQYRKIFESERDDFTRYVDVSSEFGSDENHWFILVESTDGALITREKLEVLREFDFDLRDLNFVESVISLFNVRSTEWQEGTFPLLVPWDLPDVETEQNVRSALSSHPHAGSVIISADGTKAVWVASQGDRDFLVSELDESYRTLLELVDRYEGREGLKVRITGLPAMRCEVIRQLRQETRVFYPLVALAGIVVTWMLFRSIPAVFIVVVGPLVGISWTLGAMGWAGEPLNVINNILSPLVMVIGFADGVHLLFHFRRLRESGLNRVDASWISLREVGPACFMTSITTAAAMFSLAFTETEMIRQFGIVAALATLIMFVVMIITVPLLASTPLGDRVIRKSAPAKQSTSMPSRRWSWLGGFVVRRTAPVSVFALCFLAGCLFLASKLKTNYYYGEYLSGDGTTEKAAAVIDRDLAGTASLAIVLEWKIDDSSEWSPVDALPALGDVESLLDESKKFGPAISLWSILHTYESPGTMEERVGRVLQEGSGSERLVSDDGTRMVVRVTMPELGSLETNQLLDRLRDELKQVETRYPALTTHVSGLTAMTAGISRVMILDLTKSLFIAGAFIFVLIGLFLRSFPLGLVTILPNLIPLAATAAYLQVTGRPLQYSSVLIFTVCLGIAVDDTVHLLSSYRRQRKKGLGVDEAVQESLGEVGPALITTSIILISGLLVLLGSSVPTTRLFGELSCFAILCALLGDLLLLPALITLFRRNSK